MKTIGDSAFAGCTSLTSITIPDSVTTIGNHAFSNCTSLTSITIPDSVTSIGDSAFYNTGYTNDPRHWEDGVLYIGHHLIDADEETYGLPQNVTVHPRTITIAGSAFAGCISLTSVTIGNSVTTIGDSAFYNCTSLTSIIIPDSVTAIGNEAFYDCSSLTSITIPDSVTSIGGSAFGECTSLTSITIPDSVMSIGRGAFYNTGYYNDPNHWEDDVLYIGQHLIDAHSNDLPQNVTVRPGTITIADSAFYECTSLTSITIPDSVTTIGKQAFLNCTSLSSVTVPAGVADIGERAFGFRYNDVSEEHGGYAGRYRNFSGQTDRGALPVYQSRFGGGLTPLLDRDGKPVISLTETQ